jgi:hypothetical protein
MVSSISEEALLEEWVSLVEKVEHVSPLTGSTMRLGDLGGSAHAGLSRL